MIYNPSKLDNSLFSEEVFDHIERIVIGGLIQDENLNILSQHWKILENIYDCYMGSSYVMLLQIAIVMCFVRTQTS